MKLAAPEGDAPQQLLGPRGRTAAAGRRSAPGDPLPLAPGHAHTLALTGAHTGAHGPPPPARRPPRDSRARPLEGGPPRATGADRELPLSRRVCVFRLRAPAEGALGRPGPHPAGGAGVLARHSRGLPFPGGPPCCSPFLTALHLQVSGCPAQGRDRPEVLPLRVLVRKERAEGAAERPPSPPFSESCLHLRCIFLLTCKHAADV